MPNIAAVGVGSNIDPEANVEKAKLLLTQEFKILALSKLVKTKPVGKVNQPDFLNGAILIECNLNREETIKILKSIERKMGRTVSPDKFGPRIIDLDLVVWNGEVIDPDFYSRRFLRHAVREIIPTLKP